MRLLTPLLLVIAGFMASCASSPNVLTQRLAATPVASHAYIIGTYVVSCEPRNERCNQAFNSLSTHYSAVDNKDARGRLNSTSGSIFGNDTTYDFVDLPRAERGFHFCIALPAGDYEFHTFDFYSFAGGGSGYSLPEKSQFSLPFSIAPGEVAYVGRLKLTTTTGQNIFGMKLPAPGLLLLSSDTSEAQAAALQKCPDAVRSRTIRDATLKVAMAKGNPLVQPEPPR